jgi:ubiquinone/menaquinone biosynthesis C-methylase UbiE
VDSAGGFSNIEGSHLALAEIYRILRPDGRLFMSDADVDPSSFQQLPGAEQEAWLKRFPQQGKGDEEIMLETGFEILQLEQTGKTLLRPRESVLAEMATKYGIPMYLRGYRIEARKPA